MPRTVCLTHVEPGHPHAGHGPSPVHKGGVHALSVSIRLQHPVVGERLHVVGTTPIVLGREQGTADLVLEWDARVSRCHARVWVDDQGRVCLEDLQSSNGSWVGNRRVESILVLEPGTTVRLGDTQLSLVSGHADEASESVRLEGMTIRMAADARFEGVAPLLGQLTSERVASFLEALHEIAGSLLHSVEPEALAEVLSKVFRAVPAAQRICLVAWPCEAGEALCSVIAPSVKMSESLRVSISRGLADHAARHRQAVHFHHEDARSRLVPTPSIIMSGVRSAIYVPLLEGGENVIAVLCVDTRLPATPFRPEDFQFVRAVADLLTVAITADRMRQEAHRREAESLAMKARRDSMLAFLKIASHDLKNPLAVMEMVGYLLESPTDETTREQFAAQLKDAARRARILIDTYLEVCAMESGQTLRVERGLVDARSIVDEEFVFLRSVLSRRRQESLVLRNDVSPALILADREKFRQVCSNLISNACKYSPEGGTVAVLSRHDDEGVIFSVSDQGVGISPDDQALLFEQFRRVGDQRIAPGSGLGLWMSRALVEAHGGRIWVESQPGRGATFHFRLPVGNLSKAGGGPGTT